MNRSAETLELCTFEFRVRDGLNQVRWLRQSMMPRREPDGAVLFTGLIRDITREKEAEDQVELLRSVVVRSSDAIAIFETEAGPAGETRILYINPKFEESYEIPLSEVVGYDARDLIKDEAALASMRAIMGALRPSDSSPVEFQALSRSGRFFWVEARTETVRRFEDGRFQWVVITHDITERRRVQAELLRAKEEAEAGNRAKSSFLANMSHELRTPMNAILGFSEMIKYGLARHGWKSSYSEYIDDIVDAGRHLLDLINSVLDLSKMEAGSVTLDLGVVDVKEIVSSSVEVVRGLAQNNNILLEVDLPLGSVELMGDFLRLKQVLLNVLSNAVKFTPPGGIIAVSAVSADDYIDIAVTDTGCGIPQSDLHRVMQPFVQIDNSMSRKFAGSGLGLSIASELCRAHNGRLELSSVVGEGTMVKIHLPRGIEGGQHAGNGKWVDVSPKAGPNLQLP